VELTTIKLHSLRQIGMAESQITLDDDYNVPDYRPDIVKVIRRQGELKLEEVKPALGAVWIKGKLIFKVLYRSDREQGKISCLKGELPFQEKLNVDGLSEYDPVRVTGEIEDLTVGVIHSRKLNLKAVVDMKLSSDGQREEAILEDVEDSVSLYKKYEEHPILHLYTIKRDTYRIKEEITIGGTKETIPSRLFPL